MADSGLRGPLEVLWTQTSDLERERERESAQRAAIRPSIRHRTGRREHAWVDRPRFGLHAADGTHLTDKIKVSPKKVEFQFDQKHPILIDLLRESVQIVPNEPTKSALIRSLIMELPDCPLL